MVVGFTGLILAVFLLFVAVTLWQKRAQALADAGRATQNLARTLEEHAIRSVHEVDLVLGSLVYLFEEQSRPAPLSREQMRQALAQRMRPWVQYRELLVTDASGRQVINAVGDRKPLDFSDRDYFTMPRDNPTIGLYISQPFFSRVAAVWSLAFSRRLERPDGRFAGVIVAIIDLGRFESFYASLDVGRNGNVTLWNGAASRVLARYPADTSLLGENVHGPLSGRIGAGQDAGTFEAASSLDGIERLLSFGRVGDLPLFVSVALAKDDVLGRWRDEVKSYGIVALLCAAGLFLLAGILIQQFDRQDRLIRALTASRRALRASQERFRDFAETASDWYWETDADHRFSYVSDRIRAFGIDPGKIIGKRRTDFALDQDAEDAKWRAHLMGLARHEPFTDFVYRYSVGDSAGRYSCASGKPLFDRTGRFLGYRGTGRDVTEQIRDRLALR